MKNKTLEQTPPRIRRRRPGKSRPCALAGIRRQRELRNRKQLAPDVDEREIHFPLRVREDPVAEHPLGEPFGLRLAVAALHADQREDAAPDGADDLPIDLDAGLGDALDECYHAGVILTITRA